jgi:hypothetical protein
MDRTTSALRVLFFLQAGLALVIASGYAFGWLPGVEGHADATKAGAGLAGFGLILLLAGTRFPREAWWPVAALAFTASNWVQAIFEVAVRNDTNYVPPLVLEGLLVAAWSWGIVVLARRGLLVRRSASSSTRPV